MWPTPIPDPALWLRITTGPGFRVATPSRGLGTCKKSGRLHTPLNYLFPVEAWRLRARKIDR